MKKTKIVQIPAKKAVAAKPATTKKVEETVCDFCGSSLPSHGSYGWHPSCVLCGRDCCRKHNQPDPHEVGDYPDWYCVVCIRLKFGEYAKFYQEIEYYHDKQIERLDYQVKMESLSESSVS